MPCASSRNMLFRCAAAPSLQTRFRGPPGQHFPSAHRWIATVRGQRSEVISRAPPSCLVEPVAHWPYRCWWSWEFFQLRWKSFLRLD